MRTTAGVSEDQDIRYRVRSRERTEVGPPRRVERAPAAVAVGSDPEISVMAPLAAPSAASHTLAFGASVIVVEHGPAGVTLVLPGGVRLAGSSSDAAVLAAALDAALAPLAR